MEKHFLIMAEGGTPSTSVSAKMPTRSRAENCAKGLAESKNKTYLVYELVSAFGRLPIPKPPIESMEIKEIFDADLDAEDEEDEEDEMLDHPEEFPK